MSPSARAASPATKRAQARDQSQACYAKRRWMSPSATPATRNEGGCHQVPRLPRKARRRHQPSAISVPRLPRKAKAHVTISATLATQNEGGCLRSATPATQSAAASPACHACHAKRQVDVPSVPRLPRKVGRRHLRHACQRETKQLHCSHARCHKCHASPRRSNDPVDADSKVPRVPRKTKVMSPSATLAIAYLPEGGCGQVPRLPRKVHAASPTKPVQARHPVP